ISSSSPESPSRYDLIVALVIVFLFGFDRLNIFLVDCFAKVYIPHTTDTYLTTFSNGDVLHLEKFL
ncbi:MAG: hypothetical protein KAR20_20815, partial [Candidatus Heimdallarchaeota archaeon]|nr:hypothetical protein [Candidatus Heimdallarchaeota archaeon]